MASFTQKHYKTVAHVLKTNLMRYEDVNEIYPTMTARVALKDTALDFHNVFRLDNPRYDANKFMDACGIDDWKDITEPTEHDIQPYETPDFYGEQV
jgi:hypothetical protein